MNHSELLSLMDNEISRLEEARAPIAPAIARAEPGRPKATAASTVKQKKIQNLSPEGRARIAAAAKARWAKQKRAAK
jgi:hypothetical protein